MISAGWFSVPKEIVKWPKEKAKAFLFEMFTCGGRIGYHEYEQWLKKIE